MGLQKVWFGSVVCVLLPFALIVPEISIAKIHGAATHRSQSKPLWQHYYLILLVGFWGEDFQASHFAALAGLFVNSLLYSLFIHKCIRQRNWVRLLDSFWGPFWILCFCQQLSPCAAFHPRNFWMLRCLASWRLPHLSSWPTALPLPVQPVTIACNAGVMAPGHSGGWVEAPARDVLRRLWCWRKRFLHFTLHIPSCLNCSQIRVQYSWIIFEQMKRLVHKCSTAWNSKGVFLCDLYPAPEALRDPQLTPSISFYVLTQVGITPCCCRVGAW